MFNTLIVAMANPFQNNSSLFILIIFLFLLYFFMLRPQQKQQKKHQQMVSQVKKGDHVITIGRLHGVVDEVNQADKTVTLDCDGIYLVFDLRAISTVSAPAPTAALEPETKDEADSKASETADSEASDSEADTTDDSEK